jgi:hypothetical protein
MMEFAATRLSLLAKNLEKPIISKVIIDFEAVFCDVDDVCQAFLPAWHRQLLASGERPRASRLTLSEILTNLKSVAYE